MSIFVRSLGGCGGLQGTVVEYNAIADTLSAVSPEADGSAETT